jgi:hypothetical protein
MVGIVLLHASNDVEVAGNPQNKLVPFESSGTGHLQKFLSGQYPVFGLCLIVLPGTGQSAALVRANCRQLPVFQADCRFAEQISDGYPILLQRNIIRRKDA